MQLQYNTTCSERIGTLKRRSGGIDEICLVTGFKHELIEEHFAGRFKTVVQSELLGTGHAVMQAKDFIKEHTPGNVLVLNGDAPLIPEETIKAALDFHIAGNNAATVISAKVENPFGYGRIIRSRDGKLKRIVEEKEATATEKGSKHEECKVCHDKKAAVEIPATGTPTDPQSPQTGDNSMMGLWIALLFVSGAGVVGTTVYGRKKKYSVK